METPAKSSPSNAVAIASSSAPRAPTPSTAGRSASETSLVATPTPLSQHADVLRDHAALLNAKFQANLLTPVAITIPIKDINFNEKYFARPVDEMNVNYLVNKFRLGGFKRNLANLAVIAVAKETSTFAKSAYTSYDELKPILADLLAVNGIHRLKSLAILLEGDPKNPEWQYVNAVVYK